MSNEPAAWVLELSARSLKKNIKLRELRHLTARFPETLPNRGKPAGPAEGRTGAKEAKGAEETARAARRNRALELGCERGAVGFRLRELFSRTDWTHADLPGSALDLARRLLPPKSVAEISPDPSSAPLPWSAGCFQVVFLLDLLEHIADDAWLLREARRVLAPGGLLVVTVPRVRRGQRLRSLARRLGLPPEKYGHVREGYSEDDLRALFEKSGLPKSIGDPAAGGASGAGEAGGASGAGGAGGGRLIELRPFCGPVTEFIELLLNAAWHRRRGKEADGTANPAGPAHAPSKREEFRRLGARWTLYKFAYPFLWVFSRADFLLPRSWGYGLLAVFIKEDATAGAAGTGATARRR